MHIQKYYHAQALGVNAVQAFAGIAVGGFLAVTAGTITITAPSTTGATTLLNAFPVAIGTAYDLSIYTGTNGCVVTLAGGASGTILHA